MANQKNISIVRMAMFLINFFIIMFMSIIIYNTTKLICENDMARSFLEKVKFVPMIPWKVPAYSISLLILLFISFEIREKISKNTKILFFIFSILDLIICIAVIFCLNIGYKGLLLLAIANMIIYIDDRKSRSIFIVITIIIYVLLDYDIFSIETNIFSINEYIQYYTSTQRLYIYGIRNILTSINEVLFILFMIMVIQGQMDENKKIKELYSRLFKTAEELKIVNIQLQDYAKKSEEMAKTRERNRLAREIHDTIGHTLTGIATGLEACIELSEVDIEKTKSQIVKIAELARKGLVDVRRSVNELRPDTLERFSLIPAIQNLAEDINECTKVKVILNMEGDVPKFGADEEETIYRIIQEGITNAVRHGNVNEIKILLKFSDGKAFISIKDDGTGCSNIVEGFGLKHIRERVEMLKGSVNFIGDDGKGFSIIAQIPIRGRIKV